MRSSDGQTCYYMYNGHGDVTSLLDSGTGAVAGTYYYDAFGNILDHTGTASSITYAGYQYDEETGLYYLNSRMYDPKIARFLQEDTYSGDPSDPLSLNLYTYCHNEPINYNDPSGYHWKYLWFDDLLKVGEHTEEKHYTFEDETYLYYLQILKEEGQKRGDDNVVKVSESKIAEVQATRSIETTIIEPTLECLAIGVKVSVTVAIAAPVIVAAAPVVATAVSTVAVQTYAAVSTTALGTYLWHNPDVGLDVYGLGSDLYNGNWGNIPMDMLAFAYNGATYKSYRTLSRQSYTYSAGQTEVQKNYNAVIANSESLTGAGEANSLNPNKINFSQRSVSENVVKYTEDMKSGNWDWSMSGPLNVMERDGQWVSYDNRGLMAAQNAGIDSVPVQVVKPNDLVPGKNINWEKAFTDIRFNDPRNIKLGGPVPNSGLSAQPEIIYKKVGR